MFGVTMINLLNPTVVIIIIIIIIIILLLLLFLTAIRLLPGGSGYFTLYKI